MIANLFLHPDNFVYNGTDDEESIVTKIKNLVKDLAQIVFQHSDENKIKLVKDFYTTPVYQDKMIWDMSDKFNDEMGLLASVFYDPTGEAISISLDELKEKCKYSPDENIVNSMIVLNQPAIQVNNNELYKNYITFDDYQIVYNTKSWIHLRRQMLGNHPGCPDDFITECKKYFPDLIFHDNCVKTLSDESFKYLEYIPRRIVYYLSCLNDKFYDLVNYKPDVYDPKSILEDFSGLFALDKAGSMEENPQKTKNLIFNFQIDEREIKNARCEPHLKIENPDEGNTKPLHNPQNFHPRIYFCYSHPELPKNKILIGSIGKHI